MKYFAKFVSPHEREILLDLHTQKVLIGRVWVCLKFRINEPTLRVSENCTPQDDDNDNIYGKLESKSVRFVFVLGKMFGKWKIKVIFATKLFFCRK